MKKYLIFILSVIVPASFMFRCSRQESSNVQWDLILHQPGSQEKVVVTLPANEKKPFMFRDQIDGIQIEFTLSHNDTFSIFRAKATSDQPRQVFVSLRVSYRDGTPFNFNGEVDSSEVFRQSPHDVNAWIVSTIAEQAVPVIALRQDSTFHVAVLGSPYLYDNFTSQGFFVDKKMLYLSSGDAGLTPGIQPDTSRQLTLDYNAEKTQVFSPGRVVKHYHNISKDSSHTVEGILYRTTSSSLQGLRKSVNQNIANHFSQGKYKDYFGALAFTTSYMNLRKNDSKKSDIWVVPSVEYANTQYGRDAFWISMMLTPELAASCLGNELAQVNHFAEYPLFTVLWAWRAKQSGMAVDMDKVQDYIDAIELRAKRNKYYSYNDADGRLDFQYWGDLMAFEKDDVLAYNQGLFSLALRAAEQMNLKCQSDWRSAAENYRAIYNHKDGFLPTSEKKQNILGPDPLIPDLLSMLYFNEQLLPDSLVQKHFNRLTTKAKTPYGFKIVSTPEGEYLPASAYDVKNYVSQVNREKMPDGRYFRGGSYFLYDNLFLIDAYLHSIEGAEELLLWRVGLDFQVGNTTYETLNTKTGEPWKPNMGWNVAIYSIWRELIEKGRADDKLLRHVDAISSKKK